MNTTTRIGSIAVTLVSEDDTIMLPTSLRESGSGYLATYADGARDTFNGIHDFAESHRINLNAQSPEALTALAMLAGSEWRPTHTVTFTPAGDTEGHTAVVQLFDGVAYTLPEYLDCATADWEVTDGEWRCQGQVTPGGANGTVTVVAL